MYYNPSNGTWSDTPIVNGIPSQLAATDDPGAVLPNGDILVSLSVLVTNPTSNPTLNYVEPTFIYEYNPVSQTFTDVSPGGRHDRR